MQRAKVLFKLDADGSNLKMEVQGQHTDDVQAAVDAVNHAHAVAFVSLVVGHLRRHHAGVQWEFEMAVTETHTTTKTVEL